MHGLHLTVSKWTNSVQVDFECESLAGVGHAQHAQFAPAPAESTNWQCCRQFPLPQTSATVSSVHSIQLLSSELCPLRTAAMVLRR